MAHQEDSRAALADRSVFLSATGGTTQFPKDNMRFVARNGNSTTALACQAYTALPVGLHFILDNSYGTGSLTLTPTTGTPVVVTTGKVYDCYVAANYSIKAGELAAAPT